MHDDKIRVDLCPDHFERLVSGDVCKTCPSRLENEAVVKAMSSALESTDGAAGNRAIATELSSIRRVLSELTNECRSLKKLVVGNGEKTGVINRLTVLETKIEEGNKSRGTLIAIVVAAVSTVISLFGVLAG